jgi:hypothetical protein
LQHQRRAVPDLLAAPELVAISRAQGQRSIQNPPGIDARILGFSIEFLGGFQAPLHRASAMPVA